MEKKTKIYKPHLPLGWELLMLNIKEIETITQKGGNQKMKYEKKKGGKGGQKGGSPSQGGTFWG